MVSTTAPVVRNAPKRALFLFFAAMAVIGVAWVPYTRHVRSIERQGEEAAARQVERWPYMITAITVEEGTTYGYLMDQAGLTFEQRTGIYDAAQELYDLANVRLGRDIELVYARDTGELQGLVYQIDSEEQLHVVKSEGSDGEWVAERREIEYDVEVAEASGTIESSLYVSALKQDIDERAIIAFADVFQWEVDFVMDVRVGDSYTFIYERRFLDGQYVMPGKVLAAKYVNDGVEKYAFLYHDADGVDAYFNEEGESVQKIFLRTPASFKYISSGFTTGQRYISAFNVSTGHRAIDYAAPTGTPVRTVGDGTVVFAGWGGAYGNKVSIRHNGTYTTSYCHLSRILVSYGQKVSQGQTIGKVGSTGFSTGPHLHYEMVKYGTKINPLMEEFPGNDPVPEDEKGGYLELISDLKARLDG